MNNCGRKRSVSIVWLQFRVLELFKDNMRITNVLVENGLLFFHNEY